MGTSIMKASDIANFTKTNYGQLASHARGLIVKDMNKGVLQNGEHEYKKDKEDFIKYLQEKVTRDDKDRNSDNVLDVKSEEVSKPK